MSRFALTPASPSTPFPRQDWMWGAACALFTTVLAAILSSVVFGRIPHVQDSIAQLFQARIFAQGRLWWPSPALREFFDYAHMINDGRWYAQYPPGHSLLLVPGVWLGVPWLTNPLLAGLGVFALYLLAREIADPRTARIAAALGALSPFLILMASEFMSHVSGFCLLTFFLFFYLRASRTRETRAAAAAGGCLAFALLVRPYTAFGVALPVLLHAAWRVWRSRGEAISPGRFKPALIVASGGVAGVLLLGLYNWGTTGHPFVPGYIRLYGPSHGLGFGRGSWGPPHTLVRGLNGAWQNLRALNSSLFEWPITSLWPLAVALLPLGASRRVNPDDPGAASRRTAPHRDAAPRRAAPHRDAAPRRVAPFLDHRALLLLVPLSLQAAHVFYWYHDLCFGPRYLYEALGPILLLSAFGIHRTGRLLADRLLPDASAVRRALPGSILVGGFFLYAFLAGWPALFRLPSAAAGIPGSPERMASYFQRYSREFWGVSPSLGELVEREVSRRGSGHRALVFVHFEEPSFDEMLQMRYLWFGSAFARERPDLGDAGIVYARDLGNENGRLASLFPERTIYRYTGSIERGTLQEVPRTR